MTVEEGKGCHLDPMCTLSPVDGIDKSMQK